MPVGDPRKIIFDAEFHDRQDEERRESERRRAGEEDPDGRPRDQDKTCPEDHVTGKKRVEESRVGFYPEQTDDRREVIRGQGLVAGKESVRALDRPGEIPDEEPAVPEERDPDPEDEPRGGEQAERGGGNDVTPGTRHPRNAGY